MLPRRCCVLRLHVVPKSRFYTITVPFDVKLSELRFDITTFFVSINDLLMFRVLYYVLRLFLDDECTALDGLSSVY